MGKVTCIEIQGYELVFLSNDHHPPHFHVRREGEWEIRVYLDSTTEKDLDWSLKWPKGAGGPSSKFCSELAGKVSKKRAKLLKEWEEKVCKRP